MKKKILMLFLCACIVLGNIATTCIDVRAEESNSEQSDLQESNSEDSGQNQGSNSNKTLDLDELQRDDPEYSRYYDENGQPLAVSQPSTGSRRFGLLRAAVSPSSGTYTGCDVSHFQKGINWATAKQAGLTFAFVRVGYRGYSAGNLKEDEYYAYNLANASDAGLRVGAYIYSEAITVQEAEEEADFILSRIKGYNITMPVVIDYEGFSSGHRVKAALDSGQLNKDSITAIVSAFCNRINAAGYTACIYGSASYFEKYMDGPLLSQQYRLWIAAYSASPDSYTSSTYNFWQYTSSAAGSNYGMSSTFLDLDYWYDDWTMFGTGDDSSFVDSVGTPNSVQDYAVQISIPDGYSTDTVYVDGKAVTPTMSGSIATVDTQRATARTIVAYKYDNSVPVGMYVWTLNYNTTYGKYRATEQTDLTDLLSYHGFSIRITGKSGIRVKCGIDSTTRATLANYRMSGFMLYEYGIIAMTADNLQSYPMVLNGEKTRSSVAYNSSTDSIYETVDNRYRFTSVLVGLPESQYKTEFAFRSYAVLEKDGRKIIVYGPIVQRSLSALAKQALATGKYTGETAEYLKKFTAETE